MIRAANSNDIPVILNLAQQLHDESSYQVFTFDKEYIEKNIKKIMESGAVFLAEKNDVVIGGFMGGITSLWHSPDKVGFDYTFFIQKEHRQGIIALKLIYAFEHWCKAKGAKFIQLGITTGINTEGTAQFYESLGYHVQGPLYQKRF